jgi:RNA recognition motif-containing protein
VLDKKKRSKGYGYVDMGDEKSLEDALVLDGTKLGGRAIKVARSKPTSGFKANSGTE